MGGGLSSAAKWSVNIVTKWTVTGLLKQYIKSDIAVDLFHENGMSLKNVELDEGAINTKLASVLDEEKDLPIVLEKGVIGDLSVSLSEMSVVVKGLTLEAATVDPTVAAKILASLTGKTTDGDKALDDDDDDDDVDDDDSFVDAEDEDVGSLISSELRRGLCENGLNFTAIDESSTVSDNGTQNPSLSAGLAGDLLKIHVLFEDIRIVIRDSVSRSTVLVVIKRLETVHDQESSSRNLLVGNMTVSLMDPTDNKTYPLLSLIHGSGDKTTAADQTGTASVRFGESLEVSAEMNSSSLTLSLNTRHIPFLLTLFHSCVTSFSGFGSDNSKKKEEQKNESTETEPAVDPSGKGKRSVPESEAAIDNSSPRKRISFHFAFGNFVAAVQADDVSPSKALKAIVRKFALDYAEVDDGMRASVSLEQFAIGAEAFDRRVSSGSSWTNFFWNDAKRLSISVTPSDGRTNIKAMLPPIRVVLDKYLVDMIQKLLTVWKDMSPQPSELSVPADVVPPEQVRKDERSVTFVEVPVIDISLAANRGLDDCAWNPYHYFGTDNPFEMQISCKNVSVLMKDSGPSKHISCQFEEAKAFTNRRGINKVLLKVSQANGRIPTIDVLMQPILDPIPIVAVVDGPMLTTQSGFQTAVSGKQRFLDRFKQRGMNSMFCDPFLSYSTVPGLRGKELFSFDWKTNYSRSEMQLSVVLPKLDIDISHDELCFFCALSGLSPSSEGTMSVLLNTDLRLLLRDEREDSRKYVEITSTDLAAVLISGLSHGGCPFKNAPRGMIVSLLGDSFVCKGFGFLSYPIVFLRMRESKDINFYTSNLPPIFVLTGEMKISYKNKKFRVKSLLWTPSSPVLSFMNRASTTVYDGDEPPPVPPEPAWPTVPVMELSLNPVVVYLRTSKASREICAVLSIHNILVKARIPDEGAMTVQVGLGSLQGFHRRGIGTINIIKHSRERDAAGFAKFIKEGNGFNQFLVCSVKKNLKPSADGLKSIHFLTCGCVIGDSTKVTLNFKKAEVNTDLVPETVFGLSAILDGMNDITDVLSGPTPPPSIDLTELVKTDYADTCVCSEEARGTKAVFVLDQTAEVERAGGELAAVASKLPSEIQRAVESVAFKPPEPKETEEESDGSWDAQEEASRPKKPVMSVIISNLELYVIIHFDQHNVYKPHEYVQLQLGVQSVRYDSMKPTVSYKDAPSPYFLSVRIGDIALNCDIENSSRKSILCKDLERLERWASQQQVQSAHEEENIEDVDAEEGDMMESRIDGFSQRFFTKKGSFLRLQVESRNFGEQALALTVKARMQAFEFYLTQRALAFLFEFKRFALPDNSDNIIPEQTPTVNVWTESVFDEVLIMPIKLKFNYHPQAGAPIPVWESGSGFKWIFMFVPSAQELKTHFDEFHFVAPKNRPVPLSVLTDNLLSSYYPSARNIIDIAASLGPVQLMVNFFKDTARIIHARKSDVPDESITALNTLSIGLNTVAVQTINLSSRSFLAIVRLLHWADRTISCGDGEVQSITTLADTPQTVAEGFKTAGASIAQGFSTAIDGVVRMPISAYHNSGFLSSIATFTRNVPGVVLRPVVGVGDAFIKVLFSVRNAMDPSIRLKEISPYEAKQIYMAESESQTQTQQATIHGSSTLTK